MARKLDRFPGSPEHLKDVPECVCDLIDAIRQYRCWVDEWANGVPDYTGGGWEIEPNATAKEELEILDSLMKSLMMWELLPDLKSVMERKHG